MPSSRHLPSWRLPRGVPRGIWDYAHSRQLAEGYDASLDGSRLAGFDLEVVHRRLARPGRVVDLGCGAGRVSIPFALAGHEVLCVDLSQAMLDIVGEKARAAGARVDRLRANLVELGCLADEFADYALAMFSTLAMIAGRDNRAAALAHARRILKHGGLLIVHAHNRWTNLRTRDGRRWLADSLWRAWFDREHAWGDKYFDAWGVANIHLHVYTRRELRRELTAAGFEIVESVPLAIDGGRRLTAAWWFENLRAGGWIVVCRKPLAAERK